MAIYDVVLPECIRSLVAALTGILHHIRPHTHTRDKYVQICTVAENRKSQKVLI